MARSLVGTRIRERRRAKKISQSALAKQIGISPSYLNLIEHNRRGIAGKTLLAIARALEIKPSYLSEGADQGLIDRIKKSAAKNPGINTEVQRTEEFIGRFPGFAHLIERLFDQQEIQDQNLQALSDKISNDPFFAEAMHLMLSSITSIRSTADILAKHSDLDRVQQERFLSNLLQESERLSHTAQEILQHFEPASETLMNDPEAPKVETFLDVKKFYVDELEPIDTLETNDSGTKSSLMTASQLADELHIPKVDHQRAVKTFEKYRVMAKTLPIAEFLAQAEDVNFDPLKLSEIFDCSFDLVLWRLAHMPEIETLPEYGLLQCDGSGAVLYRKQLPTFSLPRYSAACPLWPVYRSFSQAQLPICSMLTLPTGERFLTYSIAQFEQKSHFGIQGCLRSDMIFTPHYEQLLTKAEIASLPNLPVGFQCSVCPRETCKSRRNGYLLE